MAKENIIDKYSYLIGTKINKWTVLELENVQMKTRKVLHAKCECECGTIKLVRVINLINNYSKDCGCGRKNTLRQTRTKNLVGQKFGKLTVMELLEESSKFKRRLYRCKCDCGNEIITQSECLTTHHTSSCGCLLSYYNMYIQQFLDDNEIENEPEYSVDIDGRIFRFDFYLPAYNLFIEYDGEHHFKKVNYSRDDAENEKNFEKRKKYDKIKDDYCKKNDINLLRIPYWEKKNIDTIIINHLQRLNEEGFTKIA